MLGVLRSEIFKSFKLVPNSSVSAQSWKKYFSNCYRHRPTASNFFPPLWDHFCFFGVSSGHQFFHSLQWTRNVSYKNLHLIILIRDSKNFSLWLHSYLFRLTSANRLKQWYSIDLTRFKEFGLGLANGDYVLNGIVGFCTKARTLRCHSIFLTSGRILFWVV